MTQIMADNIQKGMMGWWGCKKGGFGTFVSCHIFFMSMFPGWGVSPCGPSAWWCWWWWPSGSRRQARTGRTLCSEGGSTPGSGRGRPLRWQRQNNPVMILRCFISLLSECSGWWKREKYWRQKCGEVWQHQAEGRGGGQGGQTQQGAPGQPGIICFCFLAPTGAQGVAFCVGRSSPSIFTLVTCCLKHPILFFLARIFKMLSQLPIN